LIGEEKMKKSLIAFSIATVILVSFLGSTIQAGTYFADSASWYTTKNGVLDTDFYSLYPYAKKSVNFGFSKYGELLGIPAGLNMNNQTNWIGMEYDGRDPFAPADTINMTDWINGWYLDVQYICPAFSGYLRDRHLWAHALFADGFGWGGDWIWARLPGDAPHGGRKTNGTCYTEDLQILYDGPRRFVAKSVTHVYDMEGATSWPVVDVVITMIFNRVKKEVILLKDLKLTIQKTKLQDYVDVQFSDREEYDLGASTGYTSYAHFYDEEGVCCYGPDWHMAKDLVRENVTHLIGDTGVKTFSIPTPYDIAGGFFKVWVNGVYRDYTEYTIDLVAKTITFNIAPPDDADIELHYKFIFKQEFENGVHEGPNGKVPTWNHKYDIAQVISSDGKYVAWTAFWPPVSDYTVDGMGRFRDPLVLISEADMSVEPKRSPLVIGEWDMLLEPEAQPMFRCVEIKGLTDVHDADDEGRPSGPYHRSGHHNTIDREVYYQLDEIFMPWDLYSAVEKQEYRWLFLDDIGTSTNEIDLTDGLHDRIYYVNSTSELASIGETTPQWYEYFVREGNGYPAESHWVQTPTHSKNWAMLMNGSDGYEMLKVTPIYDDSNTTALDNDKPLTLQFKDLVDFDFWYLNITGPFAPHIEIKLVSGQNGIGNWANIAARTDNTKTNATPTDWIHYTLNTISDFSNGHTADSAFQITGTSLGLPTGVFHSFEYWTSDSTLRDYYVASVSVQVESGCAAYVDDISVAYLKRPSGIRYERVYNMEEDKLVPWLIGTADWDQYCKFTERVIVNGVLIYPYEYKDLDPVPAAVGEHRPYYYIYVNGTIKLYEWLSGHYVAMDLEGKTVKVLYSTIEENDRGRYEWTVLGRDAATSDSLGATLVTAAFKNKDIEIGLGGEDMAFLEWGDASIPFVMSNFAGTYPGTMADYKWQADPTSPGKRTALKDDWCTTWPVASSNVITVGGPLANVATLYLNDFTDAFYGLNTSWLGEDYTNYTTWEDKIIALTCWNGTKKGYGATADTGYGVIATYKDINGTVGLSIWGLGPRDTYYTSKFFHEEIIYELQHFPRCVTSIILKIDYTDSKHPTCSIVEVLGTISERLVEENGGTINEIEKGGIHDP
jgi:hypothetical protein